jgi:hypothetical protein
MANQQKNILYHAEYCYSEYAYAEFHCNLRCYEDSWYNNTTQNSWCSLSLFWPVSIVMLSIIMLCIAMPSVIMLSVFVNVDVKKVFWICLPQKYLISSWISIILSIVMPNVIVNMAIRQNYFMFSVVILTSEYCYAEHHYAVYCNAEYHYA